MSWFVQTLQNESLSIPKIIVETGTHLGYGIEDYTGFFTKIYSIELSEDYYSMAVEKFKGRQDVILINGDSSDVLNTTEFEKEPILFYLDAHFCGGDSAGGCGINSPLLNEIDAILKRQIKGDVIIIDDMRLMGKAQWEGTENSKIWPKTWLDWSSVSTEDIISKFQKLSPKILKLCPDKDRLFVCLDPILVSNEDVSGERGDKVKVQKISPSARKMPLRLQKYLHNKR